MNKPVNYITSPKKVNNASADVITAVITAPGQVEWQSTTPPTLAPDEVLVRLEGCGVCASSLPKWEGREWFTYPQEPGDPGHEGWGIVTKVGESVEHIQPGDRVAILSYHAFANYDKTQAKNVIKLPNYLVNKPFPGEPLGCAMNILDRSDIQPGQTVAIIGIGFLGALLIELAKNQGATVIALSQRSSSLELAWQQGADYVLPLDDHYKIIEQVKNITNGNFCDRVIEATGKEWPLNLAGELTAVRGKLIIAGFHQDGMRQVNVQLWNWRGLDIINAHERDAKHYINGIKNVIAAVGQGTLHYEHLLTHSFPLHQLPEALNLLKSRPDGFVKAYVTMQ
ncbi:MAG: MDR/zinc-dependent alcohol dehydrogenase-like family protein [Saprospiraceae bacterium]